MKKYKIICVVCGEEKETNYKNQKTCGNGCANTLYKTNAPRKVFICGACGKETVKRVSRTKKRTYENKHVFCDRKCYRNWIGRTRVKIECQVCKKVFTTNPANKEKKFCSRKCMGIGNRHYTINRSPQYRSFGECTILLLLRKNFKFECISNDRKILDGYELDIWIPELKTGIEYNGPHHFKPVYGDDVFEHTQKSDKIKRIIAKRKGIKIIDIDVLETIHKGSKTKLSNMFKLLCVKLNLTPSSVDFEVKDVLEEQSSCNQS